jgi:hypothetical protein
MTERKHLIQMRLQELLNVPEVLLGEWPILVVLLVPRLQQHGKRFRHGNSGFAS